MPAQCPSKCGPLITEDTVWRHCPVCNHWEHLLDGKFVPVIEWIQPKPKKQRKLVRAQKETPPDTQESIERRSFPDGF